MGAGLLIRHDFHLMFANALTGVRALLLVLRWPRCSRSGASPCGRGSTPSSLARAGRTPSRWA
jgi:hypothetical protein